MIYSLVDLGSNTVRLFVYQCDGKSLKVLLPQSKFGASRLCTRGVFIGGRDLSCSLRLKDFPKHLR